MGEKVWMMPPWGNGEPKEFDATPEVLTPLMVAGWSQCEAPVFKSEVKKDVHN